MLNKNLTVIFILGLLFTFVSSVNAQEISTEKKENKMIQQDDMQKCMDKIAANSTMRMQMIDKMMDKCQNDKEGMSQIYKRMMDNPEMSRTMMNMRNENEGMMKHNMMEDSTKNMKKME